jgi:hypothetical protein
VRALKKIRNYATNARSFFLSLENPKSVQSQLNGFTVFNVVLLWFVKKKERGENDNTTRNGMEWSGRENERYKTKRKKSI